MRQAEIISFPLFTFTWYFLSLANFKLMDIFILIYKSNTLQSSSSYQSLYLEIEYELIENWKL